MQLSIVGEVPVLPAVAPRDVISQRSKAGRQSVYSDTCEKSVGLLKTST